MVCSMIRKFAALGAAATAALLLTALASPGAAADDTTGTPVSDISHACKGQNAEVEQATWRNFAYEAWMGCDNSIGFARPAGRGAVE